MIIDTTNKTILLNTDITLKELNKEVKKLNINIDNYKIIIININDYVPIPYSSTSLSIDYLDYPMIKYII